MSRFRAILWLVPFVLGSIASGMSGCQNRPTDSAPLAEAMGPLVRMDRARQPLVFVPGVLG